MASSDASFLPRASFAGVSARAAAAGLLCLQFKAFLMVPCSRASQNEAEEWWNPCDGLQNLQASPLDSKGRREVRLMTALRRCEGTSTGDTRKAHLPQVVLATDHQGVCVCACARACVRFTL